VFFCAPGITTGNYWVVKVHCGGIYQLITGEMQGAYCEVRTEGSVDQNLDSTDRNLIPRLYRLRVIHIKG